MKIDFPEVPEVDPNRPKTGREAMLDIAWSPKGYNRTPDGMVSKYYVIITEDEIQSRMFCGKQYGNEWTWVRPEALSQITWESDNSFRTTEHDVGTGTIEDHTCNAEVHPGVTYYFDLKDDGNTLELRNSEKGNVLQVFEIFRN